MSKRFESLLLSVSLYEAHEQKEILKMNFESWKNTRQQIDDVLVLGIKCR